MNNDEPSRVEKSKIKIINFSHAQTFNESKYFHDHFIPPAIWCTTQRRKEKKSAKWDFPSFPLRNATIFRIFLLTFRFSLSSFLLRESRTARHKAEKAQNSVRKYSLDSDNFVLSSVLYDFFSCSVLCSSSVVHQHSLETEAKK